MKPLSTEKDHFDERVESFLNNLLEFLGYQDFDARISIIRFRSELSFTGIGLSNDLLVEEFKPEVKENSLIEN